MAKTKDEQIMSFLHENVFDPILNDSNASSDVKTGIRRTINRMNAKNASEKVEYFWECIIGTEPSIAFARKMKMANYKRFEDCIEDFRVKFNDKFLREP